MSARRKSAQGDPAAVTAALILCLLALIAGSVSTERGTAPAPPRGALRPLASALMDLAIHLRAEQRHDPQGGSIQ